MVSKFEDIMGIVIVEAKFLISEHYLNWFKIILSWFLNWLEHNVFKIVSKWVIILWQTQIQTIKYGLNGTKMIKKRNKTHW